MNTVQGPSHTVVIEHRSDDDVGISGINLDLPNVQGLQVAYSSCHKDSNHRHVFVLDEIVELVCQLALSI